MTLRQNVQQRAVMHNLRSKRSSYQKRGLVPDVIKVRTRPTDVLPSTPVVATPPQVTPDPKTDPKNPSSSSSAPAASESNASSTPSPSPASASIPSLPSSLVPLSSSSFITPTLPPALSTPSSSSTSARVPPTTRPRIVDPSTGSSPSVSPSAGAASSTAPATTTSGLGTGTLIGIIGGSIVGVAVICMVVAFFLRRLRKKRRGADAFNSSQFRRSAVLLDEKDKQPDFGPRPPSMIERRNAQPPTPSSGGPKSSAHDLPPPPSMAYPYSDQTPALPGAPPSMYGARGSERGHGQYPQYDSANPQYGTLPAPPPPPSQNNAYGTIPGAYGVPPPGVFGAHYEQAGYGAPPVPGTYAPGAYAPYGAPDPRYPHAHQYQYQQQQQQGYPQYSNYQQHSAHHAGYGPRTDSLSTSSSGVSEKQRLRLASSAEESPPSEIARALSASSATSSSSGSTLRRQPTQSSGAPPAYADEDGQGATLAARGDVKVKPVVLSPPTRYAETSSSSLGVPPALSVTPAEDPVKAKGARPVSAYSAFSLYDQEDAYGGM